MRHHVAADQPIGIGQPLWMLVGRRIEKDARILWNERRQDDDARFLDLPLLRAVIVLDAGDAISLVVREHARHAAEWPHLGAMFASLVQIGE